MTVEKGNETGNNENKDGAPVGADSSTSGDGSGKVYDESFIAKLKGEKDNFRTSNAKLLAKVEELENSIKSKEEAALKEKEDWKTLFEQKAKEVETLTGTIQLTEKEKLEGVKKTELKKELTKLGINPVFVDQATKLADLDSVKIDKETGVVYGADVVAKTLSEEWKPLFGETTPGVTQNAPEAPTLTGKLSLDEWQKLPYDERKKREGELQSSMGFAVKR